MEFLKKFKITRKRSMTFGFVDDIAVRAIGKEALYKIIETVEHFFTKMDMKLNTKNLKDSFICQEKTYHKIFS